jgi:hypothetical protein
MLQEEVGLNTIATTQLSRVRTGVSIHGGHNGIIGVAI